jgi:DNA-binding NtrC family response regulator
VRGVAEETIQMLQAYSWPGNVRELRNVIERAIILGTDDPIAPDQLAMELRNGHHPQDGVIGNLFALPAAGISLHDVEKAFVQQAMLLAGGNQSRAARLLRLERDAFRRRLEKHGLV